eukprot:comp12737_c0_seq1/m.7858 comp12737_c0_seq1/g.7858  ORF comp12737_c0_seq1/g.7858 comp12737_c0_seq1/m.7858 type:complete len:231 (-) comp12737_c0_seq1:683-1375(-)
MASILTRTGLGLLRPTAAAATSLTPAVATLVQTRFAGTKAGTKPNREKETLFIRLNKDVPAYGWEGRIMKVKPGNFRTHLQPKNYARYATEEEIERAKVEIQAKPPPPEEVLYQKRVRRLRKKINNKRLVFNHMEGQAFTITHETLVNAFREQLALEVNPGAMTLPEPITTHGEHFVPFQVDEQTQAQFRVVVHNRPEEVKERRKPGYKWQKKTSASDMLEGEGGDALKN